MKLDRETILEEVKKIVGEVILFTELNELTEETDLNNYDLTDLDRIEIVMNLEIQFDLDYLDDDFTDNFNTIKDIVNHVEAIL